MPTRARRLLAMLALVVAGEAVFGLPFHVARFFRPTLLTGLGLGNAELGALFSAYGVLAMLSYVPGGLLADRFPARRLLAASLVLTAGLGVVMATLPGLSVLLLVYAGFGVTTILLFWAALLRATRAWGGAASQGLAFGALEGGRGLYAALLASLALLPLHAALGDPATATHLDRLAALRAVILVYTAATFAAAALLWLCLPDDAGPRAPRFERRDLRAAVRAPVVWLQAVVVFAAYCAYKGIDNYALFAMQVDGRDELAGARVSVLAAWVRPFAALAAGVLADRILPTRAAQQCFAVLAAGLLVLFITPPGATQLLWLGVVVTCAAAFGLRGVYFAAMEEARVPVAVTGTAVGLISVIGFAPDVFIAPLTGWLLDRSPGLAGHRHVFLLLLALSAAGLLASRLLRRFAAGAAR
jgi:nitrate/nitrite transporter NarK